MKIWVLKSLLSDGSDVYDVVVGESERIACEDQKQAEMLAEELCDIIKATSLAQPHVEYNY